MEKKRLDIRVFTVYCLVMLWLLFHRSRPDTAGPGFSYWAWVGSNVNLTPLHTIRLFWGVLADPQRYIDRMGIAWYEANRQHAIINLGGNVLLFLPLGFYPPRLFPKLQQLWKTIAFVAPIIIAVEVTQVLTMRGNCDIDDLLLNLIGTAIGYGMFCFIRSSKKAAG